MFFVCYTLKPFWQFLKKNLCYDWPNFICNIATQEPVAAPRECWLVNWYRTLGFETDKNFCKGISYMYNLLPSTFLTSKWICLTSIWTGYKNISKGRNWTHNLGCIKAASWPTIPYLHHWYYNKSFSTIPKLIAAS